MRVQALPASDSMTKPSHPRRRRRWIWRIVIVAILLLVASELYCRYKLGLGDPPLMMTDPTMEYRYQPSRTYHRFGNRISINAYSMRSDEFPQQKADPHELRVMLVGDSIINGGAWTDQNDIVSEQLAQRLRERLNRPAIVGNISAASWGPPNQLAYLKQFGLFDADLVIIVLGSEDYGDVPTFAPLGADAPQRRPLCALQDAVQRYVPQFAEYLGRGAKSAPPPPPPTDRDIELSLDALRQMIDLIRDHHVKVAIAMHKEFYEITGKAKPGYLALQLAAEKRDVPIIDLAVPLANAIGNRQQPFRDFAHPNALGHKLMADAIYAWMVSNGVAKSADNSGK